MTPDSGLLPDAAAPRQIRALNGATPSIIGNAMAEDIEAATAAV